MISPIASRDLIVLQKTVFFLPLFAYGIKGFEARACSGAGTDFFSEV
jgi:hypothetical protein